MKNDPDIPPTRQGEHAIQLSPSMKVWLEHDNDRSWEEEELDSFFGPALEEWLASANLGPQDETAELPIQEGNPFDTDIFHRRNEKTPALAPHEDLSITEKRITIRECDFFEGLSEEAIEMLVHHADFVKIEPGEFFLKTTEQSPKCYVALQPTTLTISAGGESHTIKVKPYDIIGHLALIGQAPFANTAGEEETFLLKIEGVKTHELPEQDQIQLLKNILSKTNFLQAINQKISRILGDRLPIPVPRLRIPEIGLELNTTTLTHKTLNRGDRVIPMQNHFSILASGCVSIHQNGRLIAMVHGPNILFEQYALHGKFPEDLELRVGSDEARLIHVPYEENLITLKILLKSMRDKLSAAHVFYGKLLARIKQKT